MAYGIQRLLLVSVVYGGLAFIATEHGNDERVEQGVELAAPVADPSRTFLGGPEDRTPIPQEFEDAGERLSRYRTELAAFRREFGGTRDMPDIPFFQFGMGTAHQVSVPWGCLATP